MKTLLIKIGKAGKTLQRDGFFRGGKRILRAFLAMFRRVKPGDILFITGGVGDSALYRCHHVAEELEINGLQCSITVQDNPFLTSYADKFKIFIFHRVLWTAKVKKLIEKIKAQNKEIIFETDDLVFDSRYFQEMAYQKEINFLEKNMYENEGIGAEILKDPYVKICTTTTTYLAEKLKEYPARNASPVCNDVVISGMQGDVGGKKKVFVIPNKLSKNDLEIVEKINHSKLIQNSKFKIQNSVKLGYFSGTISHNKDFAVITEALMQIMEKFPQVELFLVGPLDIENKLNKFKDRIKQLPYVSREKHFVNVASVDINLAPLEMNNPFCESKSELKFFEAGVVEVPTIASATGTFQEAILDGIDGFTAKDTVEWVNKLSRLILDPNLRLEMGQKAREKTLQKYTTTNAKNEEYYDYLRSCNM